MNLIKVEGNSKKDLLTALQISIEGIDCDLSGENGIEYTREEAIEKGFDTTVEYIADEVKNIEDLEELVKTFYDRCFEHDTCYLDYEYQTLTNEDGSVSAIAICTTTNN